MQRLLTAGGEATAAAVVLAVAAVDMEAAGMLAVAGMEVVAADTGVVDTVAGATVSIEKNGPGISRLHGARRHR
jgi:hypothetical protein